MNTKLTQLSYASRKVALQLLPNQIDEWPKNTLMSYAPPWSLDLTISERLPLTEAKPQRVFISRMSLARDPEANERLRYSPPEDWEHDPISQGYWVVKGSKTHTLALLLGIEPYHEDSIPKSGVWDRHGRIR